jgi:hypothetical protein
MEWDKDDRRASRLRRHGPERRDFFQSSSGEWKTRADLTPSRPTLSSDEPCSPSATTCFAFRTKQDNSDVDSSALAVPSPRDGAICD